MIPRLRPTILLTLVMALLCLACAPDASGPLWADPGTIRLSPSRTEVTVRIHNRSAVLRPIGDYTLDGPDWGAFRFVDASLPRTIPGEDAVTLQLSVSAASFRTSEGFRDGAASLRFHSDRHAYEVPIVFETAASTSSALGLAPSLPVLGLGLLAFAAALIAAGLGRRPGREALFARLRRLPAGPTWSRPAIATHVAALAMLALLIPLGPGWCTGRLGSWVGPLELAQCRAGLGGADFLGLAASPGMLWLWTALVLATVTATVARLALSSTTTTTALTPAAVLPILRLLGFVVLVPTAIAALAIGQGGDALAELVLAQTRPTPVAGLQGPRWGVLVQPLGFFLALLLTTDVDDTDGRGDPARIPAQIPAQNPAQNPAQILARLDALLWAAVIATIYFGGWTLPGLSVGEGRLIPRLPHGGELAVGMLALAAKVALLLWLSAWLRALLATRFAGRDRLRLHLRWTLPLALANVLTLLFL